MTRPCDLCKSTDYEFSMFGACSACIADLIMQERNLRAGDETLRRLNEALADAMQRCGQ